MEPQKIQEGDGKHAAHSCEAGSAFCSLRRDILITREAVGIWRIWLRDVFHDSVESEATALEESDLLSGS